jgi:2-haloacid dehalogenase
MAVGLNTIKALTFEVGGTIFDWHHTLIEDVERLAQARGVEMDYASFTNNWRWRMVALLGQVRSDESGSRSLSGLNDMGIC